MNSSISKVSQQLDHTIDRHHLYHQFNDQFNDQWLSELDLNNDQIFVAMRWRWSFFLSDAIPMFFWTHITLTTDAIIIIARWSRNWSVWDNLSYPICHFSVYRKCWNQTELNYLWWVLRMMSDVFRWFIDVFKCSQMFSNDLRMLSIASGYSIDILRCVQDVVKCSKMFSDDHQYSWIFFRCSLDVP